jgi:hypothetical protein
MVEFRDLQLPQDEVSDLPDLSILRSAMLCGHRRRFTPCPMRDGSRVASCCGGAERAAINDA